MIGMKKALTSVGFEPTPMKTTALTLRLRPLGHDVIPIVGLIMYMYMYTYLQHIAPILTMSHKTTTYIYAY